MSFYATLSKYFQYIFPYNKNEEALITSMITTPVERSLDIGCGIGHTASILAQISHQVIGIDLDETMVQKATQLLPEHMFYAMDMRQIDHPDIHDIDVITCFGNTLVHIDNHQVQQAIKDWSDLLTDQGILMIQIINYDRVLDQKVTALPTIDHPLVSMKRHYHHHADHIVFETILTDKQTNEVHVQHVNLYPLRQADLNDFLESAGFSIIMWFGGFDQSLWTSESYATIVIAQKKAR